MPIVLSPPCVSIVNTRVALYFSGSLVLMVGPVSVLALMFVLAFAFAFAIFAFELAFAFVFPAGWQADTGSNNRKMTATFAFTPIRRTDLSSIDHLDLRRLFNVARS